VWEQVDGQTVSEGVSRRKWGNIITVNAPMALCCKGQRGPTNHERHYMYLLRIPLCEPFSDGTLRLDATAVFLRKQQSAAFNRVESSEAIPSMSSLEDSSDSIQSSPDCVLDP
jgi:hypothetical protein